MTQAEFDLLLSRLPTVEQDRIRRFRRGPEIVGHRNPDAKRSLIGQTMLRRHASTTLGIPFDAVPLQRTKEGKPYIPMSVARGYNANVSHAGDLVVFASEASDMIGVDVMPVELVPASSTDVEEFFGSMRGQFTSSEWGLIRSDSDPLRRFYIHWTLKEAYIKAIGIGLGLDLQTIAFEAGDSIRFWRDGKEVTTWAFHVGSIGTRHVVAVACGPFCDAAAGYRDVVVVGPEGVGQTVRSVVDVGGSLEEFDICL